MYKILPIWGDITEAGREPLTPRHMREGSPDPEAPSQPASKALRATLFRRQHVVPAVTGPQTEPLMHLEGLPHSQATK